MQRLLAHLLLLIYAGVFLHCQALPAPARTVAAPVGTSSQHPGPGLCKKKLQTVQADSQVGHAQLVKAKLVPVDLHLGSDFAALYVALLFPAEQATTPPARGPDVGSPQVFANHPNKAPPVRFS